MKPKQFRQWLRSQGVEITNGTKHYELRYNGNPSRLSRGTSDISNDRMKEIKKQLGLK